MLINYIYHSIQIRFSFIQNNIVPNRPAIIFVIDVSYNNIKSGLVQLICAQMKTILSALPREPGQERSSVRVGFITYANAVHFYNIKSHLAQPQMMVVGDVHEMFMPLLDGFLGDAIDCEAVIDSLCQQIPTMFGETRETEACFHSAITAGLEALKASECTGNLYVFPSALPTAEAPGKLRAREDRSALGTEREKTILSPQTMAYNELGQDCVFHGVSVDLFVFNNAYIDLATIGQVCRITGGEIFKYTYFVATVDGERVVRDLCKSISSLAGFDAVMRVRTSTGMRATDFYGHFFMGNTTDMEVAAVDAHKSIAVEIRHDDKLPAEENAYVQVAILYTAITGQRRLRLLNLALKTCTQMSDLFRSCDLDAMVLLLAKQMTTKLLDSTPRVMKAALEARCAQILACYRKHCASPTSAGQLILPDCMKLLPLYASCMLKNDALVGGSEMTCDDRSFAMQFVQTMNLPMSVAFFYPRMIPLHTVDVDGGTGLPAAVRTTAEKLADDGAYLLDNGVHMFLWLGISLAPEFTQAVFGAPCTQQIDTDRCGVPHLDNALSARVRGIIELIQQERPHCMRVSK